MAYSLEHDPFRPAVYGAPVIAGSLDGMQLSAMVIYQMIRDWEKDRNAMFWREEEVEMDRRVIDSTISLTLEPRKKEILDMIPHSENNTEEKDELEKLLNAFISMLKKVGEHFLELDRAVERSVEKDIQSLGGYDAIGVKKEQFDNFKRYVREAVYDLHGGMPPVLSEMIDIAKKHLSFDVSPVALEKWVETAWKRGVTPTEFDNMMSQLPQEEFDSFKQNLTPHLPTLAVTSPPQPVKVSKMTDDELEQYRYSLAKITHEGIKNGEISTNLSEKDTTKFTDFFVRNQVSDPRARLILMIYTRKVAENDASLREKIDEGLGALRSKIVSNQAAVRVENDTARKENNSVYKTPTLQPQQHAN